MSEIKPYILKKSEINGFDFYYYLHIKGGSGVWNDRGYGGQFDFVLFYASPQEMEGCGICERIWCREKGIVFGTGKSIEDAYRDYIEKQSICPECHGEGSYEGKTGGSEGIPEADVTFVCNECKGTGKINKQ